MHQMADWLEKLGMSEYAKPFAENRIDFSVLPDLTDQDLEKLGVLLGDRRKMLRAIANLDNTKYLSAPTTAITVLSRRNSSGSLAKFTAICRASSLVRSFAAERRPGSSSK
jgi:SAM (Sterile alpha motif) domain-containing protein